MKMKNKKEISNFINYAGTLLEQDIDKSDSKDKKVYKEVANDIISYINVKLENYD